MNVVTRSLMAAGLWMYAAIHLLQAINPPDGAPAWLRVAFALTAVAAVVLGAGLFLRQPGRNQPWKDAGAALVGASFIALVLSETTGFLGVDGSSIRSATFGVIAAEMMVVAAWAAGRSVGHEYDEVDA